MTMRVRFLIGLLGGFLVLALLVQQADALTISPARIEITADPGEIVEGEIELFNEQEGARTFYSSSENFEPRGDSGAPYFVGALDGLATWITTSESVVVESGERLTVPYSIAVPADAQPGGYFAAVFFGTQEPGASGGGEVAVGGKIGALVLLRVAGDIEEKGGLVSFDAERQFFADLPVVLSYRINNDGGDRVVPKGDIHIRNTFRMTSATLIANKTEGSVLPGSARRFDVVWGEEGSTSEEAVEQTFVNRVRNQIRNFHIGWYTAELNVAWGLLGNTANAQYHFFVFPWQLLLVVAIVLGIVGIVGRSILKHYNAWIIKQALAHRSTE